MLCNIFERENAQNCTKKSNIFAQKFGGAKKWLYLCSAKRKKYGSYSNKAQMFVKTSNCP